MIEEEIATPIVIIPNAEEANVLLNKLTLVSYIATANRYGITADQLRILPQDTSYRVLKKIIKALIREAFPSCIPPTIYTNSIKIVLQGYPEAIMDLCCIRSAENVRKLTTLEFNKEATEAMRTLMTTMNGARHIFRFLNDSDNMRLVASIPSEPCNSTTGCATIVSVAMLVVSIHDAIEAIYKVLPDISVGVELARAAKEEFDSAELLRKASAVAGIISNITGLPYGGVSANISTEYVRDSLESVRDTNVEAVPTTPVRDELQERVNQLLRERGIMV